jgi:hypothetical protein
VAGIGLLAEPFLNHIPAVSPAGIGFEILQADTLVPNWTCSLSMGRDDMASRYCGRSESSESSERALVGRMNRYERDGERRMYNRDAGRARQETARSS